MYRTVGNIAVAITVEEAVEGLWPYISTVPAPFSYHIYGTQRAENTISDTTEIFATMNQNIPK